MISMRTIAPLVMMMMLLATAGALQADDCYPRSIFVPRQLSYNPILENALLLDAKINDLGNYVFSVKPIYTQSVGSKFKEYFNINHKCSLNVQEDGSGDIDSLWFQVDSAPGTFYSSNLSFHPKRQTYGALLYFSAKFCYGLSFNINTAVVQARNNMHICESTIQNQGILPGNPTVTTSFANCDRKYGRICGDHTKTGLDDIQVKLVYNPYQSEKGYWDIYVLGGIPTGKGSKAVNLFEPLVGSKHAQVGVGIDAEWNIKTGEGCTWSLLAEAKYRYGFKGDECRSFDLTANGQWSRYMLFVSQTDLFTTFPAINDLTFKVDVTPGSSFDFYLATHAEHERWNFELGYDFWYRSAEKISFDCKTTATGIGVADLVGIARQNPFTASTANISQGVQPGPNQMKSDAMFVPVTISDINLCSGAQATSISNSFYGSIGYKVESECNTYQIGLNAAYEVGSSVNTPNNVSAWVDLDFLF